MRKRKNQHVIPIDKGWAVKGEGNSKDTANTETKEEAIAIEEKLLRIKKLN